MRAALTRLLEGVGLSPARLVDDWLVIGNAVTTWLSSGDLEMVTVEFYTRGTSVACGRWDIPVNYGTSEISNDMWLDRSHLAGAIAKAPRPPATALYRIVLAKKAGAPAVEGMSDTEYLGTGSMVSRATGTIIASPGLSAGLTYWRNK